MKLLDLFCGAGGASMGYHQAGFEVVGIDIAPQPHYPFEFWQLDAMSVSKDRLREFDAIHASPPCQAFSAAQRIRDNDHPDYIGPLRDKLAAAGRPFVIENVVGAPLKNPVMLCGTMFPGLMVYRHRLFEAGGGLVLEQPYHPPHRYKQAKMGRPPKPGEWIQPVGNFSGVPFARRAMGIDWMVRNELREAIPPAYTKWVAEAMLQLEPLRLKAELGRLERVIAELRREPV